MQMAEQVTTTGPERRHPRKRRPVLSCEPCIRNKVKCDRLSPCRACCVRGEAQKCTYQLSQQDREAIKQQSELDNLRKEVETLRAQRASANGEQSSSQGSPGGVSSSSNQGQQLGNTHVARFVNVIGGFSKFPWGGWVERIVQESKLQNPTLADAVSAISMAHCGIQDGDEALAANGQRLYVSTLARLQEHLKDPFIASRPEMLYTIMFLSLFELLVQKNPLSWLRHVHGAGLLIQSRGPESVMDSHSHIRGLEHQTFRLFRLFEVILHILIRKSTFLSEPQWKSIPWSQFYPQKDIFDLLLDHLVDIVTLFERGDELERDRSDPAEFERKQGQLVSIVHKFQSGLEKWRHDWIYTYPGMPLDLADRKESTMSIRELKHLSKPVFTVDGFFAQALALYCAGHLCVLRIKNVEHIQLPYHPGDLVEFLCDAAEGQLSREKDPLAALSLLFPLRVAYFTPVDGFDFRGRVEGLASKIETTFGFSCVPVILSPALPSFGGTVSLGIPDAVHTQPTG